MDTVFWLGVASLCCFIPWLLTAYIRKQLVPTTRKFWLGLATLIWCCIATQPLAMNQLKWIYDNRL